METSHFLPEKYPDLPGSKPVESAVKKSIREGKPGPASKQGRVDVYLDRLERLVLDPQKEQKRKKMGDDERPRALLKLREMVMNKYVRPQKDKLAENAARTEERAARELGVDMHYGPQQLVERGEIAIQDLESSLDQWIAYLSDPNEPYPTWFRYYAFRNILDLGEYDKDKGEFPKRSAGTNRLFPDVDRGALAYIEEIIEASQDPQVLERLRIAQAQTGTPQNRLLTPEQAQAFAKRPFAKQYAEGIQQAGEITPELRAETRGQWITYPKDSDPTALWASLQNKGTAWCTKGFGTAATQLKGGDFHVYYTFDTQGNPTIPRIAIRMQDGEISEARGVADTQQNLEANMAEIAEAKMNTLPGKEKYLKISADMKRMTAIERKVRVKNELDKDDLVFLYALNGPIEGFGYKPDPRIAEIRKTRDPKADAPVVFECAPNEIAWSQTEISENTKAYVGQLFPGIFKKLGHLEHIYTTFPEGKIRRDAIEIDTKKTPQEYLDELKKQGFQVSDYAKHMVEHMREQVERVEQQSIAAKVKGVFGKGKGKIETKPAEHVDMVRLTVRDLGFNQGATADQIYAKAAEFGLELCPPEVGPQYRLQYKNQPMGEWFVIGMQQISDPGGNPSVFRLDRREDGAWLRGNYAEPDARWDADREFVFRLRK